MQVPRNRVPVTLQLSSARTLVDFVVTDSEVEWILPSRAEIQAPQRKSLNEALRSSVPRKPGGPHLNRHPAWVAGATALARVHQQISKPPRPAAVREAHTNKPDFVTASGREGGI